MLEIAFSQDKNCQFLGQKCPVFSLFDVDDAKNFASFRRIAQNILLQYGKKRVLIVRVKEEYINDLALALCLATYLEDLALETVVFEVDNLQVASLNYQPYAALTNALRYMRDLYRMEEKEAFADINRLGYLGLEIYRDYFHKQISVKWKNKPFDKVFYAKNNLSVFVLVALMKYWAIVKSENSIMAYLGGENVDNAIVIPDFLSEDEMIDYVINMVRG